MKGDEIVAEDEVSMDKDPVESMWKYASDVDIPEIEQSESDFIDKAAALPERLIVVFENTVTFWAASTSIDEFAVLRSINDD